MPGLAFVISPKTSLEKIADYPRRSFYLNLWEQYAYFEKTREMRFTPPVQIVYALAQAIKEYFKEGEKKRYQRYTKNWRTLRDGLFSLGFQFLLQEDDESHILMTILEPRDPNFDFDKLHERLYKKGFTIYPGKIGLEKTFRLANMGAINSKDMKNFLRVLQVSLRQIGVVIKKIKNTASDE